MQQPPDELAGQAGGGASKPLTHVTARAAMASGTAEVITRVLAVVLAIVTARVLEPLEVGLLGLSVVVIGVVSMLGFYPETAAIAARGEESESQFALAASGVRAVILACSLAALWLAFAAVARYLTGNDADGGALRELLLVLGWMPVLELVSGYPQVVMQRRLELGFIARLQILQPVLFVSLAVALLITGHGYIGVAWANIAGSASVALLLWWRLLWSGSVSWGGWPTKRVCSETLRGTAKILIGGFGGYLGTRVDNLLVAGSLGPAAMSFYSMAWNASRTPANVFARAINYVLVPTFARIQNDPLRVQRALRECGRNSYLLLAPACAVLFVTAPILVSYVIGPKWLPLVPALRVMCFTVLAAPILHVCNALLIGTGRAHLSGIATMVHLFAIVGLIPPLARRWGILGAAYGDLLATIALTLTLCSIAAFATRQLDWTLLSTVLVPVTAAILAGFVVQIASVHLFESPMRLLAEGGAVLAVYLLTLIALGGRAGLLDFAALLRDLMRRRVVAAGSQG